jgi:hypothetical protein
MTANPANTEMTAFRSRIRTEQLTVGPVSEGDPREVGMRLEAIPFSTFDKEHF